MLSPENISLYLCSIIITQKNKKRKQKRDKTWISPVKLVESYMSPLFSIESTHFLSSSFWVVTHHLTCKYIHVARGKAIGFYGYAGYYMCSILRLQYPPKKTSFTESDMIIVKRKKLAAWNYSHIAGLNVIVCLCSYINASHMWQPKVSVHNKKAVPCFFSLQNLLLTTATLHIYFLKFSCMQ